MAVGRVSAVPVCFLVALLNSGIAQALNHVRTGIVAVAGWHPDGCGGPEAKVEFVIFSIVFQSVAPHRDAGLVKSSHCDGANMTNIFNITKYSYSFFCLHRTYKDISKCVPNLF